MEFYIKIKEVMTVISKGYIILKTHVDWVDELYKELDKYGSHLRGAYILKKGRYMYVGEGVIKNRLTKHRNDLGKEKVLGEVYVLLKSQEMTKLDSLRYEGYLCKLFENKYTLINEQTTYKVDDGIPYEKELKKMLNVLGVYRNNVRYYGLEYNGKTLSIVEEGKINYKLIKVVDGLIPNEILNLGDLEFEELDDIKEILGGFGRWKIL